MIRFDDLLGRIIGSMAASLLWRGLAALFTTNKSGPPKRRKPKKGRRRR
jgi:hypothetical protein